MPPAPGGRQAWFAAAACASGKLMGLAIKMAFTVEPVSAIVWMPA